MNMFSGNPETRTVWVVQRSRQFAGSPHPPLWDDDQESDREHDARDLCYIEARLRPRHDWRIVRREIVDTPVWVVTGEVAR